MTGILGFTRQRDQREPKLGENIRNVWAAARTCLGNLQLETRKEAKMGHCADLTVKRDRVQPARVKMTV